MKIVARRVRGVLWGGMFSPRGWVVRAGLIFVAWIVLHLLGWREETRIISGTSPPRDLAAIRGVVYGMIYFAAVVLAPILLIAAGLVTVLSRASASGPARS